MSGHKIMDKPFVEKYRPKRIIDIVGNQPTVKRLKMIAEQGNVPNLILSGPPGTGKTTSIHCLAHELLGEFFKGAVMELNASDDRGIDVVRNKIKMFAQKKVTLPKGRHKIVILDEADHMTKAAQQALRRTMELYSDTTRFALACNYSNKIIEAIQSRCAILRYIHLDDIQIARRVHEVALIENIKITDSGLEAIIFTSEGDMRNAMNSLEATKAGFGIVNDINVFRIVDQPPLLTIQSIIESCIKGDIDKASSTMMKVCDEGYSISNIIDMLFKVIKTHKISEDLKLKYMKEIGTIHIRIANGLTTKLQLNGLIARLCTS